MFLCLTIISICYTKKGAREINFSMAVSQIELESVIVDNSREELNGKVCSHQNAIAIMYATTRILINTHLKGQKL